MLDFLEVSEIKNIESSVKDNQAFITIGNEETGSLVLDWSKCPYSAVKITVGQRSKVDVLELNELKDGNIDYVLDDSSSSNISVFSKNQGYNSKYNITMKANASLEAAYSDFSSGKKDLNVDISLTGQGASLKWHLASLSQKDDYKNYNINFFHKVGLTTAKMENYGVCKDQSTLNFLGDAIIEKGASKASTNQSAKIMMFDKTCHAKASPKLCIYENDVEASHGASEGQINSDHIFYLTSRGISEDDAKRLLTFGYLYPIIQYFKDENIRKDIEDCIIKRV